MTDLNSKLPKVMDGFMNELSDLVSIPSVSSDPDYEESIHKCAEILKGKLENMGAKTRLIQTSGYPLVVGNISNKKAVKTIAIYNHYDVQPIASPDEWKSAPFELAQDGDKWYARGASDDKGNLLVVLKAVKLAIRENLPINFQFIYEGEEEKGSPNFVEGLKKAKQYLNPDIVIVADGGWISRNQPTIEYGLRGLLYMHWNLKTARKNAHSGSVGGAARNPILEVAEACSRCIDAKTGKIKIPGVYDDVRKLKPGELESWMESGFEVDQFMQKHGLHSLRSNRLEEVLKAIWARPTFEAHGLVGGYMKKDGRMTVLPKETQLLVSMRLVADQDPDKIFELVKRHLEKINPDIEVVKVSAAKPYLGKFDSPNLQAASRALNETFGLPVAKIRAGGSIGAVPTMYDILGQPEILLMAFGLPEHGAHGPNEYFDHKMAQGGIKAYFKYFETIVNL